MANKWHTLFISARDVVSSLNQNQIHALKCVLRLNERISALTAGRESPMRRVGGGPCD